MDTLIIICLCLFAGIGLCIALYCICKQKEITVKDGEYGIVFESKYGYRYDLIVEPHITEVLSAGTHKLNSHQLIIYTNNKTFTYVITSTSIKRKTNVHTKLLLIIKLIIKHTSHTDISNNINTLSSQLKTYLDRIHNDVNSIQFIVAKVNRITSNMDDIKYNRQRYYFPLFKLRAFEKFLTSEIKFAQYGEFILEVSHNT